MTNIIDEISTVVALYDASLTDAQLRIYIEALADIDQDMLHLGIVEIIKTSKWMPKPSEIREAARLAQERNETQLVMDWHTNRNNNLWHQVTTFDFEGGRRVPLALDWQACKTCGAQYANWTACPDCVEAAR